jgi:hypothetical protein
MYNVRLTMMNDLSSIDWALLPQPEWNQPDTIPKVLRELATAKDRDTAREGYHRVLYALGNNHAGSYFPVAVTVVPFLGEILECGADWSRETVLDILIDLWCSFVPEPAFPEMMCPDGSTKPVELLLKKAIVQLRPLVQGIVDSADTTVRPRKLAQELLESILGNEGTA